MDARTLGLTIGLAGAAISLIVTVGVLIYVVPRLLGACQENQMIRNGHPAEGRVRSISQTGLFLNEVPQMRMVVSLRDAHGERELTIKQFVEFGNMPRAGERVHLLIDGADTTRAAYIGLILPDSAS